MYRRREQDASPNTLVRRLEPARSVLAPIALMMRLKEGRRKPTSACFPCMLQCGE
jgi:hypothetical protein